MLILYYLPSRGVCATASTNNFITINISRSDGLQPPPPSPNNVLNKPILGYNGASFTVSVFAGRYSVSV
jgi:hypothetical protein